MSISKPVFISKLLTFVNARVNMRELTFCNPVERENFSKSVQVVRRNALKLIYMCESNKEITLEVMLEALASNNIILRENNELEFQGSILERREKTVKSLKIPVCKFYPEKEAKIFKNL